MVGTATSSPTGPFRGGSDSFSMQITNVNSTVTEDIVKDHLKGKNIDIGKVVIKNTTTDGWPTKRFLITLPSTLKDQVMDQALWPPQVYFRQYFIARGKGSNSAANNG